MKRLLAVLACAACSGRGTPTESATPHAPAQPAASIELAPPAEPGPSIYDLPVQLIDADGRSIGLDIARGKPVLVTMFYASCTIACPLLISEVARVISELPPDAQRDVQVLLVSFDSTRDTPAKLTELAHQRKLDAQWILAAANDADARAIAAVLGVKYRKLANGEFAHGSTIVALDRDGRALARTDSLGHREPLLAALSQ